MVGQAYCRRNQRMKKQKKVVPANGITFFVRAFRQVVIAEFDTQHISANANGCSQ